MVALAALAAGCGDGDVTVSSGDGVAVGDGFAADVDPPSTAADTGYRSDDVALWMDPHDDRFVYLVGADVTERWPRATQLVGCA